MLFKLLKVDRHFCEDVKEEEMKIDQLRFENWLDLFNLGQAPP